MKILQSVIEQFGNNFLLTLMYYTRIYTDDVGHSCFEVIEVPLHDKGAVGLLSESMKVSSLQFRENKPDYNWDFHVAPQRQFIILLDGEIEIENSRGEKRSFKSGDILLVEDTEGKGHRTKNISQEIRRSIFVQL
jgi:hypothetical protein